MPVGARARLRHARPGHRYARLDARAQRRREAARVARDHGHPLADGTLAGYLGIGRDITAERQAARELRDAEERFRNAFDQAPIGKALVSLDGRFTRVNAALGRILGHAEQELLGVSFQSLTHPDDLDADLKQMHRLIGGQSESLSS